VTTAAAISRYKLITLSLCPVLDHWQVMNTRNIFTALKHRWYCIAPLQEVFLWFIRIYKCQQISCHSFDWLLVFKQHVENLQNTDSAISYILNFSTLPTT